MNAHPSLADFSDGHFPHVVRSELLGLKEAAELLGISKGALRDRAVYSDVPLPQPVAMLACGPIWTRDQIVDYARKRCRRFNERPGVQALARSAGTPW